ncbi:aminoglycoside phosphotransferase family protein [Enterococcus sp. HY326]|uniref:aminoglycoside phosphotransferase family protein n=1 Tax=Enterococcus sp. HY326 TaxID=2971265 RepID=UPI00223F3688|nr:phosphotransferase [Enterococcus sp. HY326]
MREIFQKIADFGEWQSYEVIDKGWSDDIKIAVSIENKRYLYRLFSSDLFTEKLAEFHFVEIVYQTGIPCSQPFLCQQIKDSSWAYMKLSYVEGKDLSEVLSDLPLLEQYQLGQTAGKFLKRLHEQPLEEKISVEECLQQVIAKKRRQLDRYLQADYHLVNQDFMIDFIQQHLDLIRQQPITYQHGDYHPGNFILQPDNTLAVIDFNRWDIGDSFEEFVRVESFTVEDSTAFAWGQIFGYFNGNVPESFWLLLKVYAYHTALYSIIWSEFFGKNAVNDAIQRYNRIVDDYANQNHNQPRWLAEIKQQLRLLESE